MGPVLRWHPEKAHSNLRKRGATFEEAASVFRDTLSVTISDPLHSTEEDRFVIVVRSEASNPGRGTFGGRGDDSNHQCSTRNPA